MFRRHCGVTPKAFAQVCRLQRFLDLMRDAPRDLRWADLVEDGGYHDQSHLIHAFSRFTGMKPTAYLDHRRVSGDDYPSFLALDDVPAR